MLVHFHDVFLPDPYPEAWAWRGYNEQQAIAVLLQGEGYGCRFASHYVATRLRARLERGVARPPAAPGRAARKQPVARKARLRR